MQTVLKTWIDEGTESRRVMRMSGNPGGQETIIDAEDNPFGAKINRRRE